MSPPQQPHGWHTLTPRLFTPDVEGLVAFLRSTFDAHGDHSPGRPAEVTIGDSIVMVSDGAGVRAQSSAFLYVYVRDTDETYRRAIDAGARSIEPPAEMPYGDRRATVEDPWGNTWQIATHRGGTNQDDVSETLMSQANSVDPTRLQFDAFKALPRDAPIQMLNLIRLKPLADYPADHPDHGKGLTGLDAYRAYGRTSAEVFARVGARQVWVGRPETVVTGPADERWDLAFIAEYPSAGAFLAMVTDPDYREHVKHRTAGVEDSRLIRLAPMTPGADSGNSRPWPTGHPSPISAVPDGRDEAEAAAVPRLAARVSGSGPDFGAVRG